MTALDAEFNAELTEIFREEATTRLDQMDKALLAMESGNADAETIDSLFRNAHTIKGSAGMLGFADVRSLGHAVEDILASVREEGVFPPELAEPLMRATAGLRAQITGTAEPIAGLLDDLAASVAAYRGGDIGAPGASLPGPGGPEVTVAKATVAKATVAQATVPEATVPEASVTEASVPGPTVPGPTVPEASVPEASGPEAIVPGPIVPGPIVPAPTATAPTVPRPTVPRPTVPGPSVPGPSVPERRTLR